MLALTPVACYKDNAVKGNFSCRRLDPGANAVGSRFSERSTCIELHLQWGSSRRSRISV
jgi:hypothetical protein